MANGFESQKIDRTSIDDLLKLVQGLGQMGAQREAAPTKTPHSRLSDFSDNISSTFDNSMIDMELQRMENYFSSNQDNMTSDALDEYNYIKEQAKYAKQDNSLYETLYGEVETFTQNAIDLQNKYNSANEEDKFQIAKDLENNMTKFIKAKGNLFKKFGNRLALPQYAQETRNLESLDDIFLFGINSLKDNNYFDDDERNVFSNALIQGKTDVIDEYVGVEAKAKQTAANFNLEKGVAEVELMKNKIDFISKYNKAQYDKKYNVEEYETYKNNIAYTYTDPISEELLDITYEDLENHGELKSQYESELIEHDKNLNLYDKAYGKVTKGQSIIDMYDIAEPWKAPEITPENNNIQEEIDKKVMSPSTPEVGSLRYKQGQQENIKSEIEKEREESVPEAEERALETEDKRFKLLPTEGGKFNQSFEELLNIDLSQYEEMEIPGYLKGTKQKAKDSYLKRRFNKLNKIIERYKEGKSTGGSAKIAAVKEYNTIISNLNELDL